MHLLLYGEPALTMAALLSERTVMGLYVKLLLLLLNAEQFWGNLCIFKVSKGH